MKAVILAGGYGSRLSEETSVRPKPMVEIGGLPILWHIMKIYASHGIRDFVICAGYKGDMIKEYFVSYAYRNSDLRIDLAAGTVERINDQAEPWTVTVLDTGLGTATGGRIRRAREVIGDARFCFTYGDGLSDVPVGDVIAVHEAQGCLATVTAVPAPARFGALDFNDEGTRIRQFMEKGDANESWINGGFFVMEPDAIDYVQADDEMWEHAPMEKLVREGQLAVYRHEGFWHCMDHLADKIKLEELWQSGAPPWKSWS